MKLLKNKFILNTLILLIMTGISTISYHAYIYFQQNERPVRQIDIPAFLQILSTTLDKIDTERLSSASYLTIRTKSHFENVINSRNIVDNYLLRLNSFVQTNNALQSYNTELKKINQALVAAREAADSFNKKQIEIIFDMYHNEVFMPFKHILNGFALEQRNDVLKHYLLMYEKMIVLKENTVLENTMIYPQLLKKYPRSSKEKMIWDQIIAKDHQPQFSDLLNELVAIDLRALLSAQAYQLILKTERQKIIEDETNNSYRVTVVSWLGKIEEKIKYFKNIESILLVQIEKSSSENLMQSNISLISYGLSIIVLLILLFRLLSLRLVQAKNRQLKKETLRDIKLVFTPEQQKRLKWTIEDGNINLIYKYLIEAIKDANQTKDLFLASMSHEIRTPLNGILGFTQLLKETKMTEEQNEFLSVVEKSSDHLLTIVNDILDLSKIKAQKIVLEHIAFDPLERFEAAAESYTGKAIKENIDFNVFIDPKLPTQLLGDPTKISQVLVNLLSNAIKFTSNNGEVNVDIERLSENDNEVKVKFSVSDTGIGISKEQRERIFEAYSQADISTSRKYGGTGLGLSISGKLIDRMGGKLGIRSVQDKGSTFYFTLVLEKSKDTKQRIVKDIPSYHIGILNPHIDEKYCINKNLELYCVYAHTTVTHYTDTTLFDARKSGQLPDILFIDHKFRQRGEEIKKLLDINCKIVLVSTGDQKRNLNRYESRIDKILYKPVTFTKTLKALSEKEESSEEKENIRFENIHILVAEDNLINQKLIMNVLNRIGVEVSIANNGQEALDQCMAMQYDMIFMDIEMPIMGGMEATAKILNYERNEKREHTPIIALTANALSGDKEKYLGVGMDNYLSKPIKLDALRAIIEYYFEKNIVDDF